MAASDCSASELELLASVGLAPGATKEERDAVTRVDLFQTLAVRSPSIARLRGLQEISLVQAIGLGSGVVDFGFLPALRRAFIVDCGLASLEGLRLCDGLEELVVDSNQLEGVEGFSSGTHPRLRKLWANNNRIHSLESFAGLTALEELSLARNRLTNVGRWLDGLSSLQRLNVSDNGIGHFRELRQLARLPALRELALSDPHWGANPVCSLCNYGTFSLCQLPRLEALDTVVLDDAAKQAAEATFTKKQMYYNMRTKTLKRNTHNVVRRAGVALRSRARAMRGSARLLHRALRDVRRDLRFAYAAIALRTQPETGPDAARKAADLAARAVGHEAPGPTTPGGPRGGGSRGLHDGPGRLSGPPPQALALLQAARAAGLAGLHGRALALERLLCRLVWAAAERALAERALRWQLSALRDSLTAIASARARRLVLELSTGGNIRLEDGSPRHAWYKSCAELVLSRFHARDFAAVGVAGVQVRGVTKIHNRHLRAQFDRRMAGVLAADPELASALGAKQGASGAPDGGSAGGRRSARRRSKSGAAGAAHSGGADGAAGDGAGASSAGSASRRGGLEYLFFALPWRGSRGATRSPGAIAEALQRIAEDGFGPREATAPCPLPPLPPPYFADDAPSFASADKRPGPRRTQSVMRAQRVPSPDDARSMPHSVVAARGEDARQRQWVVLDPALALPEYVVEFDYVWESEGGRGRSPPLGTRAGTSAEGRRAGGGNGGGNGGGGGGAGGGGGGGGGDGQGAHGAAGAGASSRTMGEELTLLAEVSLGGRAGRAGDGEDDGEDEETAGGGTAVRLSAQEEADLKPLVRPLARFVEQCRAVGVTFSGAGEAQAEALEAAAARACRPRAELRHGGMAELEEYLSSGVGAGGLVSGQELLAREGVLDLHGSEAASLSMLPPLGQLRGVRELVLSFCGLFSLAGLAPGLASLPSLLALDLSFNAIDSLLVQPEAGPAGDDAAGQIAPFGGDAVAAPAAAGAARAAAKTGGGAAGSQRARRGGGRQRRVSQSLFACPLAACPGLKRLLLHDNRLASLSDLQALSRACPALEEVSLAYNPVAMWHMDAERPRGLAAHGVWSGGVSSRGELALLGLLPVGPPAVGGAGELPERVALTGTPWRPVTPGTGGGVSHTRYRSLIVAALPGLRVLDGCRLSEAHDASGPEGQGRAAGTELVMRRSTDPLGEHVWPELDDMLGAAAAREAAEALAVSTSFAPEGDVAPLSGAGDRSRQSRASPGHRAAPGGRAVAPPSPATPHLAEMAGRWAAVDAVDVSACGLRALDGPGLRRCGRLRRLDASGNLLSSLASLQGLSLPQLEELVVEDNRIGSLLVAPAAEASAARGADGEPGAAGASSAFAGIAGSLQRLDMGSNCLSSLSGLECLTQLVQLSLESNELTSLDGLDCLHSLLELYAGNNKVRAVKEVRKLRSLPKLIILDLCGNPLCGSSRYRLFSVYTLRRLKVLDGVSITSEESADARDRYSGKLTLDFLEEKLTAERLPSITELDLSSSKIRDIEPLPAHRFRSLACMNLSSNLLTAHGLRGLRGLPSLQELRLGSNKISTLLPAIQDDPDAAPSGPGSADPADGAFSGVEVLDLSSNAVSSVEDLGVHLLPALKALRLSRNDVGRIRRMPACPLLRELHLDANRLRSIDDGALVGLAALRVLRLRENSLRTLAALTVLQTLQLLDLASNRVSDIREVENLAALPYLVDLTLTSNPVARKQLYRPTVLRSLDLLRRLDGREATDEEKRMAAEIFNEGPGGAGAFAVAPSPAEIAAMAGRVPVRMASGRLYR
ncbi:hypothetical protein FNF27_04499 [Cafeteria roenbergensis]|uniref:U2A'/phosphoprotein 32 family A C-terminal domain-containing protein n=1 Tax=Cafeteria roenbergensis TaxID=33653 RepID=A0A5A8E9J2_CAFRO|nr:hypothetical protein FNF27_04499 [Cafeteria roenbergensis]